MILICLRVPSFVDKDWPHVTESWLFCSDPGELRNLKALGSGLSRREWRGRHCPPHWRITDEEARGLPFQIVDSETMTIHARGWRRHFNDLPLPKPKSHKKGSGRPSGRPPGA